MTVESLQHKKKLFFQLGLYVASKHPELAEEIITNHLHVAAIDDDLNNLQLYYTVFMKQGKAEKPFDAVNQRRLFVSAMLHIYAPGVFNQKGENLSIGRYGLQGAIASLVGVTRNRMSQIVRETVGFEHIYEEYRNEVKEIVTRLTTEVPVKSKAC